MWTWDSTEITHDQSCWTYDGYNGCDWTGGGSDEYKYKSYDEMYQDKTGHRERIMREDDEIALFIKLLVTKGFL